MQRTRTLIFRGKKKKENKQNIYKNKQNIYL